MSDLDHQKTRQLLHKAADKMLTSDEKLVMDAHLESCTTCRKYEKNIAAIEVDLKRVLHTHWDNQHPNINLQSVTETVQSNFKWASLISPAHAIGKAVIAVTILLGYFIIADLFESQYPMIERKTPTTAPTPGNSSSTFTISPTPSAPSALTQLATQACKHITYIVQANDTLDNIALQFKISKEEIVTYNNIKTDDLSIGHELTIPVCDNTPSQTPSNTMASTPLVKTALPTQKK